MMRNTLEVTAEKSHEKQHLRPDSALAYCTAAWHPLGLLRHSDMEQYWCTSGESEFTDAGQ